ncbi:MAG: ABC transporter ATP-binding protein/permease [archaeon]|nr:ABC transporter ATP-binding protein/permease [archaeon]
MSPPVRWNDVTKAGDFWGTIRRLFDYIGKYRYRVVLGIVTSLVYSLLILVAPQYLGRASDILAEGISVGSIDMGAVTDALVVVLVLYIVAAVFKAITRYYTPTASELNANIVRKDLSGKIKRIPLNILDRMRIGDVMSRFTNDSDVIRCNSADSLEMFATSVVMIAGATVMMLLTDWRMTIVAMLPILCGLGFMSLIVRKSQKYFKMQARDTGTINTIVEESYNGIDIINSYNARARTRDRFRKVNRELYNSSLRATFITDLMPSLMGFINNLSYLLVCVVGAMFIIDGSIGYGVIVAFIVYVREIAQPLERLPNAVSNMQNMVASAERVFEFLDTAEIDDESEKKTVGDDVKGEIVFDHVHFSYVPGKEVVHDLDLTVRPGQKIAIVGPTGSGKTTIANLLLRFYDLDSGTISLDGTDLKEIRRDRIRETFCMVLQDSWIMQGTVKENIRFNRKDVSDGDVVEACRAVGIDRFIETLPEGYDTVIGGNLTLSSGQKQQINIARALVRDSPVLILDEATSSVDTRTERLIQEAMDRLMKGRTSFVIAHRLSTIVGADLIIVLRDGNIVEMGTHGELLEHGGFYRQLYDSQFEACE